jgi:SAM-dependent methyltransferase
MLPPVEYVGVDQSARYIEAARSRFGSRGRFDVRSISETLGYDYSDFDIVLATGVLHHLSDEGALSLFRLAKSVLRPEGVLVTLDGVYVAGQSAIARGLLRLDRGKFVRSERDYLALASDVFPTVEPHIRHDLLRIPYTHLVMRCTNRPDGLPGGAAAKP